ncbi:MAG: DNA helicase RecQ [Oscillospiraceae bacterium]|nr:DNA helicase RecQ [Oscillospiraceae bacterium]MDY6208070.1 DNA helicase RecQ [Oscillospiraceae bacterium]
MVQNDILKKYFGYESFRPGQDELVESIISGRDTLGVMPTGAGKSLCYQIPALMMEGITIVVSPLISLMQDQVGALVQSGIRAAYINSSLTMNQLYAVIRNAEAGVYKLIYVAPERLDSELFVNFARKANISMITVDEAHCISQWGQDFRPSYLNIPKFAASLPQRPVMTAFTATATQRVRDDIVRLLELRDPFTLVTGFDRKNLYFEVRRPSDKFADLKRLVTAYDKEGRSGIVYCSTRKNVEDVCAKLCEMGFSAARYHAGLSEEERRVNQEDFIFDRRRIMVATNAFGMGIDKSNVTFVIHYNMPKDVESYYQEAGRAGRDGSPSDCILLYSGRDVITAEFLINKSYEESEQEPAIAEETKRRDLKRLRDMTYYCTCGDCLRGYILRYFGEKAPLECGCCSVCCSDSEETDITVESQKIISCIYRAGQRFGIKVICDILRGSESEKLSGWGLDKLSTYGIMKETSERRIRRIMERLEVMGYIKRTEGDRPVLTVDNSALEVLRGTVTVKARIPEDEVKEKKQKETLVYAADPKLMEILKKLRQKIASVQGVPAYFIFTDATLADMCEKRPCTPAEFLNVSGVGSAKLERYGDEFIGAIKDYCGENPPGEPTVKKAPVNRMKTPEDRNRAFEELERGISQFSPSEENMNITALISSIITAAGVNVSAANLRTAVLEWLISEGYLQVCPDSDGGERKGVTGRSAGIGIFEEQFTASSGKSYTRVLYSPRAQRFIADNLGNIGGYQAAHL